MELWKINVLKSEKQLNKDRCKKSYEKSHIWAVLEKCQMRIVSRDSTETEINAYNINFFLAIPQFGILTSIYLSV